MLLAWLVTGVFSALLLWRVRMVLRGAGGARAGRRPCARGLLVAAVMGGSVLVYLAADAQVSHEDLAWSVALTVGSTVRAARGDRDSRRGAG